MKFPSDVLAELDKKYWQNRKNLKALLKGEMDFPLQKISLKMPTTSSQVQNNLVKIQEFVQAWKIFEVEYLLCKIEYQAKNFQQFGLLTLPKYLLIEHRQALIELFAPENKSQLQIIQSRINYIINTLNQFFEFNIKEFWRFLIDNLENFEHLSDDEIHQLLQLLPQLKYGMAQGLYLRNLAISGVDTKFIEQHFKLIELLLNYLYENKIYQCGGLLVWLNCQEKPSDWLLVKPLCQKTQSNLANLPILRLNSQTLLGYELPSNNILVVENEQSCLALTHIPNTIAVAGGGKNVNWLKAEWLKHKKVYYWGDIDCDGLFILSLARQYCPHMIALMMDKNTVLIHQHLMVNDSGLINEVPLFLTADEKALFIALKNGEFMGNRLEQERLSLVFIQAQLAVHFGINSL